MNDISVTSGDIISNLIALTADNCKSPIPLVDKIIKYQFKAVSQATAAHCTVEISGVGYLYCSDKKIVKKLIRARAILHCYLAKLAKDLSEKKRYSLVKRIESIEQLIERYESRLERTHARNI
ncbi:hypothetical protein SAMN05428988_3202 [Chitinophaga sp. YR573]|uniref:hypothetical protein n=1 Tax=Chitinophaga sp. YR573 TaxID=1881040 RepID=UPI0008C7BE39|nr:hypothetical protein [Chitinophaga sp. YR573]SEW21357.1 hypothetical protein SAMN05428988_3202 [Chitinophaga sp. YR573]